MRKAGASSRRIAALVIACGACVAGAACGKEAARPDASAPDPSAPPGASSTATASATSSAASPDGADAAPPSDAHASANAETTATGKDAGTEGGKKDGGAVSDTTTAPGGAAQVTVGDAEAGKTIELAKGQTLVVLLTANPTSGFDWTVTKSPPALGKPALDYVAPGTDALGASGKRKITFTVGAALPAGELPVELAYARSFEKGVAPFKTFAIKVRAHH